VEFYTTQIRRIQIESHDQHYNRIARSTTGQVWELILYHTC